MNCIKINSIRIKLLLGFSGIFLLMLGMLVLLSNYFLDDFFIYSNKKNVIMQTKHISLNNDLNRYRRIISEITKNTGGKVLIYDENLNLLID